MGSMGYTQSDIDPCLYIKRDGKMFLYLLVHVDDIAAFAELVGCIKYLCDHSRGDLLFAAERAAMNPTGVIPRQILRYIKKTKEEWLWLRHDPKGFRMHAFSDAS